MELVEELLAAVLHDSQGDRHGIVDTTCFEEADVDIDEISVQLDSG